MGSKYIEGKRNTVVKSKELDYLGSESSFAMTYVDIICLCLISCIHLPYRVVAKVNISICKTHKREPDT